MEYIAHFDFERKNDRARMITQSVKDHCISVATICSNHTKNFGFENTGYLLGLLHDMGKCCKIFQDYIRLTGDKQKEMRGKIDHSTIAAKYLYDTFYEKEKSSGKKTVELLSMIILSHHSGLQNFAGPDDSSDFLRRVIEKDFPQYKECVEIYFKEVTTQETIEKYFSAAKEEVKAFSHSLKEMFPKDQDDFSSKRTFFTGMLIKQIHGMLIDSDWLDSGNWFCDHAKCKNKERLPHWDIMFSNLKKKYEEFGEPETKIEKERTRIAKECEEFAEKDPGIYLLPAPTGAGKTLSVMLFALKHAQKHKMRRIIEIVPFTSIIEQNADQVRKAVQTKNSTEYVCEHHCNIDSDKILGYTIAAQKRRAAIERWDRPIIFSTQVRFLDMLFGANKGDSRRLNSLYDSIIIFDEIQTMPLKCTYMFILALNFLKDFFHCTIILSSATQPCFDKLKYALDIDGLMISNLDKTFEIFKRVHVTFHKAIVNENQIASGMYRQLRNTGSCLCIVNTTSAARTIVTAVHATLAANNANDIEVFYLSTKLCPAHRKATLQRIKECLSSHKKIICVTTQLIEAGVDISFPNVYRSAAGLDSIAQAAGRCNRNGELPYGNMIIFDPGPLEKLRYLATIQEGKTVLIEMLSGIEDHNELSEIFNPDFVAEYYSRFYLTDARRELQMSYPITDLHCNMLDILSKNQAFAEDSELYDVHAFRTAEENFRVIEQNTTALLIPYEKGRELIDIINTPAIIMGYGINEYKKLYSDIQQYSVNIWDYERSSMTDSNLINTSEMLDIEYLSNAEAYSNVVGIMPDYQPGPIIL